MIKWLAGKATWIVAGALLLAIAVLSFKLVMANRQIDTLQAEYAKAIALQMEQYAQLQLAYREQEQAMQLASDQVVEKLENEIAKLQLANNDLIERLRERPQRPATQVPATPTDTNPQHTASRCTGAELYREDGLFLAREAARADEIRLHLIACQQQYNEVRGSLQLAQ